MFVTSQDPYRRAPKRCEPVLAAPRGPSRAAPGQRGRGATLAAPPELPSCPLEVPPNRPFIVGPRTARFLLRERSQATCPQYFTACGLQALLRLVVRFSTPQNISLLDVMMNLCTSIFEHMC